MKRLTYNDIESLKIQAGYGEGPVVIPREAFEELVRQYGKDNDEIVKLEEELEEL